MFRLLNVRSGGSSRIEIRTDAEDNLVYDGPIVSNNCFLDSVLVLGVSLEDDDLRFHGLFLDSALLEQVRQLLGCADNFQPVSEICWLTNLRCRYARALALKPASNASESAARAHPPVAPKNAIVLLIDMFSIA